MVVVIGESGRLVALVNTNRNTPQTLKSVMILHMLQVSLRSIGM